MGFFEAVVRALLTICMMALVYWLVLWAIAAIGFTMPPHIGEVLLVILVLITLLILARLFYPWVSGPWFGPSNRDRP